MPFVADAGARVRGGARGRAESHLRGPWFVAVCVSILLMAPQGLRAEPGSVNPLKSGELHVAGDTATFSTSQMTVKVTKGVVTRLFNRVTGTEYIVPGTPSAPSDAVSGLVYAKRTVSAGGDRPNVIGPTLTKQGETVLKPTLWRADQISNLSLEQVNPLAVRFTFHTDGGDPALTIEYALDDATGDVTVLQKAAGQSGGLSALRWGLGPIAIRGNLLVPAFGGMKAARPEAQYKFEGSTWGWPMGWQIPLVVFADAAGGFAIHTEDPSLRFKEVMYQPAGEGRWQVAFSTVNQAPFESIHSGESVTWRINTFSGDWTVPVDRYKRWSYQANKIAEKEKHRPRWVDDIKLVIKHADYIPDGQIVPFLDELQKHVNPAQTLLFLTFYKDSEEKQPIPYWLPNPHGIVFTREARRRGFRVMYFANYIGIMPNHPKFADFKDHVIRDAYSGKLQGWNLEGEWARWDLRGDKSPGSDVKLYYVSPAYKPWRDYQIAQFKELFKESPADGLFLDQAFLIFNDGNGLVNGADTIRANLDFHREIAEALPGVALGGESVNEITMQYESFFELHLLSLDLKSGSTTDPAGWWLDSGAFDRMVPLTTRFVSPHTHPIGYVGFPDTSSPYYEGWRDGLRIYSGILTLTRPSSNEMQDGSSEVRRVMHEAFPHK
jgi:Domain of unknown function (DUF6259)